MNLSFLTLKVWRLFANIRAGLLSLFYAKTIVACLIRSSKLHKLIRIMTFEQKAEEDVGLKFSKFGC